MKTFHNLRLARGSKTRLLWLIAVMSFLVLTACIASYEYNIIGTWDYTMYTSDGNPYDKGTITFSGNPMNGSYLILNYDQEEIEGTFTLQEDEIRLTVSENWMGTLSDENTMSGEWWHGDGTRGTFEATRQ